MKKKQKINWNAALILAAFLLFVGYHVYLWIGIIKVVLGTLTEIFCWVFGGVLETLLPTIILAALLIWAVTRYLK